MMRSLPFLIVIAIGCLAVQGQGITRDQLQDAVSVKDFGAKGDGVADDTAAVQNALKAVCGEIAGPSGALGIYLPAGTYNISSPLVTGCGMFIAGDGPAASVIFQTLQATLQHGIIANFPLTIQDVSINTKPLLFNKGMIAVFRKDTKGPAQGQTYTFLRFNSSGFNFGIDIAGTSDLDLLGAVQVLECNISVNTEPNAVANPVNVGNSASLTVEDSTLTGDLNNDHAIYLIGVRKVLIENNRIQNNGNSAVKLLTGGFKTSACPPLNNDYSSWDVLNNIITHSKLALAAYTYCDIQLPSLNLSDNRISNISDAYAGDAAAFYIQANCQSVMEKVTMSGNLFEDIGLSGVFLLSSVQGGPPCVDLAARGTIDSFVSASDKYINFSTAYPGSYYAISTSGQNLHRASISQLSTDGQGNGRAALNLGAFDQVSVADLVEINMATR